MQKILFLDIDGPVIPATQAFINRHASWERMFAPQCIAIVKHILDQSGAKLVTNSTHNQETPHLNGGRTLREDLIAAGIQAELFHPVWKTQYPNISGSLRRLDAIELWQAENGQADWIALDDANFTDDERLVLVDFDCGLTVADFNKVAKRWGFTGFMVL